jgi:hypothetical protein
VVTKKKKKKRKTSKSTAPTQAPDDDSVFTYDMIIEIPQRDRREKTGHGCSAKFKTVKVPDRKGGPVKVSSDVDYETLIGLLAVALHTDPCNINSIQLEARPAKPASATWMPFVGDNGLRAVIRQLRPKKREDRLL